MNFEVQTFRKCGRADAGARDERRGCVVTGLRLNGISGLESQSRMRQFGSLLPFLILAKRTSTSIVIRAVREGACL